MILELYFGDFLTTNPYLFMLHNLILYYSQFFNSQGEFGFWIWTHDDVWVAFFCTFVLEITMDECMHNGDTWSQTIIFILTNLSNLTSDFFPRILEFQRLHLCWWRMLVTEASLEPFLFGSKKQLPKRLAI